MPRPRVPFVLDITNPMRLDDALDRLFHANGLRFAHCRKDKLKTEMLIGFEGEHGSFSTILAKVEPVWKTVDEHDDLFYDAAVQGLKVWLAKRRERGFQLMARNMAALIPKLPGGTPGIYDFGRAAGNAVCSKCGLEYVEHPIGLEEFLHLLCDGNQVKL